MLTVNTNRIKATLDQIDPFDARRGGLRRLESGRLRVYSHDSYPVGASADIWATPDDRIFVRFSYASHTKDYFQIILPRGVTASNVNFDNFLNYLGEELANWFYDARYD